MSPARLTARTRSARPGEPQEHFRESAVGQTAWQGGGDAEGGVPTLEVEGYRAVIRLNRPRHHNRLQPDDVITFGKLLDEVQAARDIRVLLVTGAGPSFCSGYHLGAIGSNAIGKAPDFPGNPMEYAALADRMDALPMPTIAVVNGSLYGGGVELAVSCDFRIGVTPSRMFIPVARFGSQYLLNGMKRLVHRLGLAAAKRILLAGEEFDAEAMLRMGLLDELATRETLWDRALAWSDQIAKQGPLAVRAMKVALNEIARGEFDEEAARARGTALQKTQDAAEGIAAREARRQPVFQGR